MFQRFPFQLVEGVFLAALLRRQCIQVFAFQQPLFDIQRRR